MSTEQIYKTVENIVKYCDGRYTCEGCLFHMTEEEKEINGTKTRCCLIEIIYVLKTTVHPTHIDLKELRRVMNI